MDQKSASGRRDLVQGPVGRNLLLFALPVLGTNFLQSLNGTVNAIWVSHVLGEAALAATSNANNVLFLLMGAAFGMGMSANLMIAQAVGADNLGLARRVVGSAITFFVILSSAIGVLGYVLTPQILHALGAPPDTQVQAEIYLRVIFAAMPFMYFFSFVMMAQRGTGDSRTPFLFSLLSVGLDALLNPLLIMGIGPLPRMGIAGSAAATLISQSLTLALMILHLHRRGSVLVLRRTDLRLLWPSMRILRTLVFKGLPMALQIVVMSGAALVMISFVNAYGSAATAAYGAATQLWSYVQMPAMALGAAISSMAAQNVGAGRMDRLGLIARSGAMYGLALTAAPVVIVYLAEPYILGLFLPAGGEAHAIAVDINTHVLWSFLPFAVSFTLFSVVRATGSVMAPLILMASAQWLVRLPFAALGQSVLGQDAIWWSFPLSSTVSLILACAYYRWGGWRKSRLLAPDPQA